LKETINFPVLFSMRVISLLLIAFFFVPAGCVAQQGELSTRSKKAAQRFHEARGFYEYKKSKEAASLLKEAVEIDPEFFEAHMLLANVLDDLDDFQGAIVHYKEAIRIRPDRFPPNYYNLAGSEMKLGQYEEAVKHLETFLAIERIHPDMRKKGEARLANCRFAEQAVKNPVPFSPMNLGEAVNTPYDEYHPAISADEATLIFTRSRPRDGMSDVGAAQFEEDFYMSRIGAEGWSRAVPLGPPVNSHGNEGAHCLSPDGNTLYFTACGRNDGMGSCDLYISQRLDANWTQPQNLGPLNSVFWDTQPSISADGREIIFVSKREGTLGGGDLYQSFKNEQGRWSKPRNMGPVLNTPLEESGPFLHPDGQTLYFTSAGHPGMGGQDLFISRRNADSTWSKPENLGYPINTSADEEHLVVNSMGNRAYFSSARPGGTGGRDLYIFELPGALRPKPVTFLRGIVTSAADQKPLQAQVTVTDLSTGVQKAMARSNRQTGAYLVCIPSGSSYAINASAPGHLFYSGNYTLPAELGLDDHYEANISLQPITPGAAPIVLKNIFFESGSSTLLASSFIELNKLVELLKANQEVRIEIGGHTDDVGTDSENLKLSQARAQSVVDFLVSKEIAVKRLLAKGYGEAKPIADNKTNEGRSQNRRTEITILAP
jgi:outer membrane protein OmpA-like peptidoglycan-associated protein